jgi:hypothetical protein
MAGSLRWFNYTSDAGQNFAVFLDESNSKGVGTPGGSLFPAAFTLAPQLAAGVKKRYLNCFLATDPTQRRRFYVGTLAAYNALQDGGTILAGGLTWNVSSAQGERRRSPYVGDTGQTDGTAGNT